jgi:hypothetical protein
MFDLWNSQDKTPIEYAGCDLFAFSVTMIQLLGLLMNILPLLTSPRILALFPYYIVIKTREEMKAIYM